MTEKTEQKTEFEQIIANNDITELLGSSNNFESTVGALAAYQTSQRTLIDNSTRTSHCGNRDLWKICSYPELITYQNRLDMYRRHPLANAIVNAYPDACLKGNIIISDNDDPEPKSDFDKAIELLKTKYNLIDTVKRAFILALLGYYSTILVGINDGNKLSTQARNVRNGINDLLKFAVYSYYNCYPDNLYEDTTTYKFGQPEFYTLHQIIERKGRDERIANDTGTSLSMKVHESRIIHISQGNLESQQDGEPMLDSIFNDLLNIMKVSGASAEAFFLNVRQPTFINIDPTTNKSNDPKLVARLKKVVEALIYGFERVVPLQGAKIETVTYPNNSPKDNFETLLKLIAGKAGIPLRILIGSESGNKASTQDVTNFNARVQEKQLQVVEPKIIRPLIDRLIKYKILPAVEYQIKFPKLDNIDEKDKGVIDLATTRALDIHSKIPDESKIETDKQIAARLGIEYDEAELKKYKDNPRNTNITPEEPEIVDPDDELTEELTKDSDEDKEI